MVKVAAAAAELKQPVELAVLQTEATPEQRDHIFRAAPAVDSPTVAVAVAVATTAVVVEVTIPIHVVPTVQVVVEVLHSQITL
jgi:hypothetical protein